MNIIVNARVMEFFKPRISYEEVVELAKMNGTPSMIWRNREGRSGIMAPGDVVTTGEGMVFNVDHTGNA
jgi:hypothetical protein